MFQAEIGDYLYIIIFFVLMIAGVFEKMAKAKRQQNKQPLPSQPYDDFEDVEGHSEQENAPPQSLEDMLKRMMQATETQTNDGGVACPYETPLHKQAPDTHVSYYQPIVNPIAAPVEKDAFLPVEEGTASESCEFEFNIRQAVIASEILNKKY